MITFGYQESNLDHTFSLKKDKIIALIIYVDDMVVTRNDPKERKALQNYLFKKFEMKNLGPLKYFLQIKVFQSYKEIDLSQIKYVLDLLEGIGISVCQLVDNR